MESVQFSHTVVSNSLWFQGLQQARPPCPSPTPRGYSNSVIPSNHLILCHPFLLPPSIFPSIRSFQWVSSLDEVTKVLSFSFSISPSNEYSGLISGNQLDLIGWLVGSPCSPRDFQASSTPRFKNINSSALRFLYSPTLCMTTGKTTLLAPMVFWSMS